MRIYDELSVSPGEAVKMLKSTRAGAIVGSELAKRYDWEIGHRFVIQSPLVKCDGSRDWTFDVVGRIACHLAKEIPAGTNSNSVPD